MGCNSLKSSDAHQTGNLAHSNRDGGTGHETAHGRSGNEFDDLANSQETYAEDDEPLG